MAAEVASAFNAHYCATKAYDLKLAEALWDELRPSGVDVLGFMPGPTVSPGYEDEGGHIRSHGNVGGRYGCRCVASVGV